MEPSLPEMGDAFELRIQLRNVEPAIWRRLLVPAEVPLGVLHEVIQVAFGWQNTHLHDFQIGGVRVGMVDVEDEIFKVDEFAAPLGAVANVGPRFLYRYDFGDDWEHDVIVEGASAKVDEAFACTGGARSRPPEDCGGPPGYANLLAILGDPDHPEHREPRFGSGGVSTQRSSTWSASTRSSQPCPSGCGSSKNEHETSMSRLAEGVEISFLPRGQSGTLVT